jgi:hypothetical protein
MSILDDQNTGPAAFSTNWVLMLPPQTTPLLLDYEDFHPRPPKSGKNVVYMDNHVAPLDVSPELSPPGMDKAADVAIGE